MNYDDRQAFVALNDKTTINGIEIDVREELSDPGLITSKRFGKDSFLSGKNDVFFDGKRHEGKYVSFGEKIAIVHNGIIENYLEIKKELGDVLWYVSQVATELTLSLDEVALCNIEKLQSRKKRGKLSGSGDNR